MRAIYIEHDKFAAEWLRRLILFGHIAPGDVYEGDIQNVRPIDLEGYRQVHAFAGIGVWSYALRLAGWPDDRPVWTGSCPCQPFSLAGKGAGFEDPRHLWPHWYRLIGERRPVVCFGEQVASAGQWLDLVSSDLEALDYAVGAVSIPAAGFGGAHIRQRIFWVADAHGRRQQEQPKYVGAPQARGLEMDPGLGSLRRGAAGGLVDAASEQAGLPGRAWEPRGPSERLEHAQGDGWQSRGPESGGWGFERGCGLSDPVEWIPCQDNRWRPIEPLSQPLAHAAPARVGRLRGYGNALDAETATRFIEAYMDI